MGYDALLLDVFASLKRAAVEGKVGLEDSTLGGRSTGIERDTEDVGLERRRQPRILRSLVI